MESCTFNCPILVNYYSEIKDIQDLYSFGMWLSHYPKMQILYWSKNRSILNEVNSLDTGDATADATDKVDVNAYQVQRRSGAGGKPSTATRGNRYSGSNSSHGRVHGAGRNHYSSSSSGPRQTSHGGYSRWKSQRFKNFKKSYTSNAVGNQCYCVVCRHIREKFGQKLMKTNYKIANVDVDIVDVPSDVIAMDSPVAMEGCPYQLVDQEYAEDNSMLLNDLHAALEFDQESYFKSFAIAEIDEDGNAVDDDDDGNQGRP